MQAREERRRGEVTQLGEYLGTVEIGDFACFIGLFCLIGGLTLMNVRRTNLIPLRDPRLRESLNFHNI